MKPHAGPRSSKKVANSLVALSSAAVLTVYSAGYARTRAAADRYAVEDERRPAAPARAGEIGPPQTPRAAAAPFVPVSAPVAPTSKEDSRRAASPVTRPRDESRSNATSSTTAAPAADAALTAPVAASAPAASTPPVAPAPVTDIKSGEAAAPAPAPAPPQYKDGTYYGWGTSRHGDIQAYVVIDGGHIVATAIAQCLTRYSCSWIAHLPGQVITRQSADVDYVTGATQSTNAFYYAIVEALSKAK